MVPIEEEITETAIEETESDIDDSAKAFLSLPDDKKRLVLLMGDVSKEALELNNAQRAAQLGLAKETFDRYMKDSVVLDAIDTYRRYHFRQRLEYQFQNDMLARYEGVDDKPLTKEDRQLVARMFNMDAMPVVQINLKVKDSKLKNIL